MRIFVYFLVVKKKKQALLEIKRESDFVSFALSVGVKRPGREADHSSPSSAEVKECVELYFHSNTPLWRGAQ
jgi:hypothetical protein